MKVPNHTKTVRSCCKKGQCRFPMFQILFSVSCSLPHNAYQMSCPKPPVRNPAVQIVDKQCSQYKMNQRMKIDLSSKYIQKQTDWLLAKSQIKCVYIHTEC